jgi:hypothetical protein
MSEQYAVRTAPQIAEDVTESGRYHWDNVQNSALMMADWLADIYFKIPQFRTEMIIHFAISWGAPKSSLRDYLRTGIAWPQVLREEYPWLEDNYSALRNLTIGDEPDLNLARLANDNSWSVDKIKSYRAGKTPWHEKLKKWISGLSKFIANLDADQKEELKKEILKEFER